MDSQSPRLVCLGNLTIDDVYLPDGSYVPNCTGGDALYAALAARLWEPSVQLVAPIGNDMPEQTKKTILSAGFTFDGLPARDVPTIHNRIFYHADGSRRWEFLFSEGNFGVLSPMPEDIPSSFLSAEAFLILAMSLDAQEVLIPWLQKETDSIIALDAKEDYVQGNEARILTLIEQVDIFLPSTSEVSQLMGHSDWLKAAEEFVQRGPEIVVIKQGSEGSLILDKKSGQCFSQIPAPVEIIDTTGAGDAYCGGFLAGFLEQRNDLKFASQAAAVSASYAIASFGMDALIAANSSEARSRLRKLEAA